MKKHLHFYILLLILIITFNAQAQPLVYSSHETYNPGDTITIVFENGWGNPADWVGLYKVGDNVRNPIDYLYVNNTHTPGNAYTSGRVTFNKAWTDGVYWVGFFKDNQYEVLSADTFSIASAHPFLNINKYMFEPGEAITVHFKNGPGNANDWIGIYKTGDIPGIDLSTRWFYVNGTQTASTGISEDTLSFNPGLNESGKYWVGFFASDSFTVLDSVGFSVEFPTDVEDNPSTVTAYELKQNFPNPFNPNTRIQYSVASPGMVTLKVFDVVGRQVAELVNEFKEAGTHIAELSSAKLNLTSGVYFYKLQTKNFISTRKMILLK